MGDDEQVKRSVKKIYDEDMAEVFRIVSSLDATQAQVSAAKSTAKDLTSMLLALVTIEGRTALARA